VCESAVRWEVVVERDVGADSPGQAITSLLHVPEFDEIVVASASGNVCVLHASTGRRLATLEVIYIYIYICMCTCI
jgi:hypothetical protein